MSARWNAPAERDTRCAPAIATPARKVLMGVPARVVRGVYGDELLENR